MASQEPTAPKTASVCDDDDENDEYCVLIEFAFRHLDFQLAELESVLDMHGIDLLQANHDDDTKRRHSDTHSSTSSNRHACRMVPLAETQYTTTTNASATNSKPAAARMKSNPEKSPRRPFVVLALPFDSPFVPRSAKEMAADNDNDDDDAKDSSNKKKEDIASIILSRCTLVRSVLELWSMSSDSLEACAARALNWTRSTKVGKAVYRNNSHKSSSWKLTVHTLGTKYTREEQDAMRELFSKLEFPGPVQMAEPTNEFVLIREVELNRSGGPLYPRHSHQSRKLLIPENDARPPLACYFGRALGDGGSCRSFQRMGGKMQQYSLKQRKYLGPTSMDAELSFIMTNLGQVQKGQVALDPFVGTGSILLSCALRGAYCVGTDIDIRVLKGKSSQENILTNFRQFDLPRPELIRSDNGIYHRHFLTSTPMYNAILCDPPYGIRAGARKSGSRKEQVADVLPENRHNHIAQTQPYAVSDVMADLVDVSARTLELGGRLVYVIPSFADDFDADTDLPQHKCLEMVHVCYQPLSAELGRRMVVMKKVKDYDASKRTEYLATVWKNGAESADKCANIRVKLMEAAKTKPRYEERKAIRKEKRRKHKEEKKEAKRRAKLEDSTEAATS